MRKVVTGMWIAGAMLALGGVALANDPSMHETGTPKEVEQQSGMESETSFDVKSLEGQQAMKLQEKLKEQGLYHGQIDGKIGPLTQEALRKFQEQKGFGASGKLDSQTAAALGLDTSDIQPVSGQDDATQPATDTSVDPVASPTPMTNSGSTTTEPDSGVDKAGQSGTSQPTTSSDDATATDPQSGADDGTIDDATLPENTDDVETQSGDVDASDNATGTGSMNSDVESTTEDPDDRDTQSGTSQEDSTSPVTGGGTETEETEPTSGDTTGGETLGGEGVSTDDDSNVVNDSEIEPQAGTSTTFDKKTIKQVEKALREKKLFDGKVDGVLDEQTTQAIRAFQSQQGIAVTGQLDADTLAALGVKQKVNQGGTDTTLPGTPNEMTTPNPGETPMPNETPVIPPIEPTNPSNPGGMTPR